MEDAQVTLFLITVFGLVGIIVFACQFDPFTNLAKVVSVIGAGLVTAGAAALVGGMVGFIFGLPHSGQAPVNSADPTASSTPRSETYVVNTNLDQVSDWLTKLIVGVGLVQLGRAPKALGRLANGLAPGFGGQAGASAQVALAVAFYFAICGFLQGYVWARLTLPRALRDCDLDEQGKPIPGSGGGNPTARGQAATRPVVAEPVVAEPVVAEPVVAEPVVAEPGAEHPGADAGR